MRKLFFLFFLCYHTSLKAQVYISLSRQQLDIDTSFRVKNVIDLRESKLNIGKAQLFITNTIQSVKLRKPLEQEILSLFEHQQDTSLIYKSLILRINELKVYELTMTTKEFAFAGLNMDFVLEENGKHYLLYQSAVISEEQGVDVTKFHDDNIKKAVEQSFSDFYKRLAENKLEKKEVDLHQPSNMEYVVQDIGTFPKGVFASFNDFKDNQPIDLETLQFKYFEDARGERYQKALPLLRGEDVAYYHKNIWGFSDGKNVFVRTGGGYRILYQSGGDFFVKFDLKEAPSTGVVAGSIIGGALGGLVVSALENKPENVENWKINFSTGGLSPQQLEEAEIIIYNVKYNYKKTDISIWVDGIKQCDLANNTIYIFRTKDIDKAIEFCVEVNGDKMCKNIKPDFEAIKIYDVLFHKKNGVDLRFISHTNYQKSFMRKMNEGKLLITCEQNRLLD